LHCFIDHGSLIIVKPDSGSTCIGPAGKEHEDMLVALICLWIGFAIGLVTAAVLRVGSRDDGRLPRRAPARHAFEVSRVRPGGKKAGETAARRSTPKHAETVG